MQLVYAVVSMASGVISAYLMNRERMRVSEDAVVIAVQLTGWFWLGFFASLALATAGLVLLLRGNRATAERN